MSKTLYALNDALEELEISRRTFERYCEELGISWNLTYFEEELIETMRKLKETKAENTRSGLPLNRTSQKVVDNVNFEVFEFESPLLIIDREDEAKKANLKEQYNHSIKIIEVLHKKQYEYINMGILPDPKIITAVNAITNMSIKLADKIEAIERREEEERKLLEKSDIDLEMEKYGLN